jgi:hypothetical protein
MFASKSRDEDDAWMRTTHGTYHDPATALVTFYEGCNGPTTSHYAVHGPISRGKSISATSSQDPAIRCCQPWNE